MGVPNSISLGVRFLVTVIFASRRGLVRLLAFCCFNH